MVIAAIGVIAAGGLLIYNNIDDKRAKESVDGVVNELEGVTENVLNNSDSEENINDNSYDFENAIGTKYSYRINNVNYIGIMYIPSLDNLTFPIIDKCDMDLLRIAPCRYYGKVKTGNLVIAGHNYKSLFNKLGRLQADSILYFKEVNGEIHKYRFSRVELIRPEEVDKMVHGDDWDLTLFTCTNDSRNRNAYRFVVSE